MKQTISSPIRKLKLLMVVPLIAGVFYAFAAPEYKFTQSENTNVVPKVKTISGKVIAEDGKPLKGASILVVEGGIGTVTDANGNFKLEVPDDMPLAISYVGFETQKVLPDFGKEKVIIMKSKTFSIKLDSPNSKDPKKVQEDLNQTNALIIVDGKEIAKVEMEKIKPETIESISVLKGESAAKLYGEKGKDGVILVTLKNDGQTPQILKVQSNSPLKFGNPDGSGSQPMIVKDGLIVKSQDVNNIPPENIESINVLKGEKAISKYGQKGSSGVVEIWTKKDNAKDVKSASEPIPFTITGNSTNSTDQANSVIEGFGKKPLVVIDGVISDIQSPDKVPSDSIASISILKGESAISKYGEKGKNGVMEIKTKKVIVGNSSKIGNINWVNNTVFSLAELNKVLRMQKGDQYSKEILNRRIWTDMDGVSSIYLDKGYVFSKIDIAETPVNDGTVNLTFTVYEGNRGKIGKIDIKGNKKVSTDDIRHKIVIKPGDLFSKTKIVQSVEALSKMSKLDPEAINPGVIPGSKIPNSEFINVDLVFNVTEK